MATKKRTSKTSAARKSAKKTASAATTKKTAPSKKTAAAKKQTSSAPAKSSTDSRTTGRKRAPSRSASKHAESVQKSTGAMSPSAIAVEAARQLFALTGRHVEGVTGLQRTDDGWTVEIETVELRRIPDTSDMLALYEVELNADGDMVGYRRARRYVRGSSRQE